MVNIASVPPPHLIFYGSLELDSLIFMGLDETLSVKSTPIIFQKCKRGESSCILVTVIGRYLGRHQDFEN